VATLAVTRRFDLTDGQWALLEPFVTALPARADAARLITWEVGVDSTIARAHQHAAGAHRREDEQSEPPGGVVCEPFDHALGRSRGGLTTKIHLSCEQGQNVLSLIVTAGQRGDDNPRTTRRRGAGRRRR
jgi:hypothetical protein